AGGAVVALWTIDALVRFSPLQIPRLHAVHVDGAALAFTALASIATGVLSGIVPAFQLSQSNDDALREGDRGGTSRGNRTRHSLVVAEMALSIVLLASAGLLARSLAGLQAVRPGFATDRAVAMQLLLPPSRYPKGPEQRVFAAKLHDELRTLPGVRAVAIATTLPMSGSDIGLGFTVQGRTTDPSARTAASFFAVSPDYFSTLRI